MADTTITSHEVSQSTSKPRLPRYKRTLRPPAMVLTDRDVETLRQIHQYRIMTREQIEGLLFQPENGQDHLTKTSICRRRLRLLYHHGFVERFPAPVRPGAWAWRPVYRLTAKGAELALGEGNAVESSYWGAEFDREQRRTKVSLLFLEHTLRVNDVRIAFTLAADRHGWQIERWLDDADLKGERMRDYVMVAAQQGRTQRVAVLPDAYFVLRVGDRRAHFFLELDQATISNPRWRSRVLAYIAYTESGKYQQRYQTHSLRILTVTTTAKRLANLQATTEKAGGGRLFWFTTFAEVIEQDLLSSKIWRVAGNRGEHRALVVLDGQAGDDER